MLEGEYLSVTMLSMRYAASGRNNNGELASFSDFT